ncbi:hypothetical protein SAMN05216178_7001 [Pseudomonas saponiphila]|uniref:Uncharacterized protein n=1 Tax=Pseudomonas saponiphila TaxID=556534 RepID=A0A1H5A734_9PSED|nr:hypothetical protein [Pseudomonas saponiphila]SED37738.1 hypothetical protein SAMN05216178_7001 [Pseudomonas saponiphila]
MSAYFAAFVNLPVVVDEPGDYVTRCGETVTVSKASSRHDFGCVGTYANCGTEDRWHKSGRLQAGRESNNDIVSKAESTQEQAQ